MALGELAVIRVTSITLKQTGARRSYSQKTQHTLRHSAMTTNWETATWFSFTYQCKYSMLAIKGSFWLFITQSFCSLGLFFFLQQPNQKQPKAPLLTLIISCRPIKSRVSYLVLTSSLCWSGLLCLNSGSASSEGLGLCGLWRRVLQRDLVNLVSRC